MSWYRLLAAIAASARRSRKASGGGVAPSFISPPALIGTPQVGVPMSYTAGVVGGSPAPTVTRQWLLAGAAITGATNLTYTPVSGDAGLALSVRETATNGVGSPANSTSGTANVTSVPAFTAPPVILGTPTAGTPVAYTQGTVTGSPTPTRSRQWLRNGANISGATSTTYTPVDADIGTAILSVRETATNGVGSPANSTSTAQDVAGVAPSWTVAPAIIGTPSVGTLASLTAGTLAGAPAPTLAFQWTLNGVDISGATSATYTPITGDIGSALRRVTTATNGIGSPAVSTSVAVNVVSSGYDANATFDAMYVSAKGSLTGAKWVATTGNDTTGNGTNGNPYLTIGKAIDNIVGGGCVIVKDGTYTGTSNWISATQRTIPAGSSGAYTRIFAENRFGVRITYTSAPSGYEDAPVNINSNYVWVDGIVVESTFTSSTGDGNDGFCFRTDGLHTRFTRCIGKRKTCDQYGGIFWLGGGENYTVVEDCMGFGSYRYMFQSGAGGSLSAAGKLVHRRCIGYGPFGLSYEPTAIFSFYGANDGTYALCKDVLYANCYSIDSPHFPQPGGQNAEDLKWGEWYHPKSVRNVKHIGCGSVNSGSAYGSFCMDNYGATDQQLGTFDDCFSVGSNGGGNAAVRKASNGTLAINHFTASGNPAGPFPGSGTTGANNLTSSVVTPTRRVSGNGAEQLYCVGAFLTEYGETGYDVVQTSMRLWPLPYEDAYKTVWAETITKVASHSPAAATVSTSPCAGTSIGGASMTFTHRVWESLGTTMPNLASGAGVYP